jgi:peptide/nickel transport system permease protein
MSAPASDVAPSDSSAPAPLAAPDFGSESPWQLIRRRFLRHRLAVASLYLLAVLYGLAVFAEFFAPYTRRWRDLPHAYCPPQLPRWSWAHGLHVLGMRQTVDPITLRKSYVEDPAAIVRLGFFVRGEPYAMWGVVGWDRHFIGVRDPAPHIA